MKLTAETARQMCLDMWDYIAENIIDSYWRDKAMEWADKEEIDEDVIKEAAYYKLFGNNFTWGVKNTRPNSNCFLCEYHRIQSGQCWLGCKECCLGLASSTRFDSPPCYDDGNPFKEFCEHVENERWIQASSEARNLANVVKQWKVTKC